MTEQALSPYRVLDLTHYIAGPYCTWVMAALGAEVIKVERPGGGDGARRIGPFFHDEPHPEKGALFLSINSGKKSITLDLKTETGKRVVRELVKDADCLVESFRPGVMAGLGLSHEELREINPGLVMTSISSFGQTGPYRDFKATELIIEAIGGLAYSLGDYEREPIKFGLTQSQYDAGKAAALSTVMALFCRPQGGQGQYIDVPVVESATFPIESLQMGMYLYLGGVNRRSPKFGGAVTMDKYLMAKDGWTLPIFYGYVDWYEFARLMESEELANPEYETMEGRLFKSAEVEELMAQAIKKWNKREMYQKAMDWRFAWAVVQTPDEVVNCPHLADRGFFAEVDHPEVGPLRYPGLPFKLSETPWRLGPAPLLGEHNAEIYGGRLGYTSDDLVRLRERGII
ncbi:MAG: CoA transferase [Chloroflexota bacterium]|nr:CoA transferase [Chloroflexota bacterium]